MTDNNELVLAIKQINLEPSKVESLLSNFSKNFQEAKTIANEAKSIIVTDESQIKTMQEARKARLTLKNIRVEVEKTRVSLKEQSVREGKAIDGMANIIKALIIPVEEHLEKQEKYAEFKETERLLKRHTERVEKLSKFVEDVSLYNLMSMSDEAFENLLKSCEQAFNLKKETEEKVEADRIELEKKQNTFNKRQLEFAPYKDFINSDITNDVITLDMSDSDYQKLLKKGKDKKLEYEKQQEKIRKENEELRIKSEKDQKAKEEAELKLKQEKETQEKKEQVEKDKIEADKKAQEEIKRKALLAPDKDKLRELWRVIDSIEYPNVSSRDAQNIVSETEKLINVAKDYLIEKAKTL